MKQDGRKVNFSPMALQILEKRYLKKTEDGIILETPEQLLFRVAAHVCEGNESLFEEALNMMRNLEFLPNTPTLMNAGTTNMLSACFAIPISDSLESIIHEALWQQAAIHKKGGGTGLNFSTLRPKGDPISSTGGVTCGVLSFMQNFDTMSKSIRQGGKRAGANMSILSIYHPEIEDFITIKSVNDRDYENMNLSVLVDDAFMLAVKNNQDIFLSFPVKSNNNRKKIGAKYLWNLICDSAHKCGCPGILFEDTINSNNTLDKHGFHITTTNPCWTGDTKIWTINGVEKIENLVGKEVEVLTQNNFGKLIFRTMRNIRKTQHNSKIIEIDVKNRKGKVSTLRCTENHNFYLTNGNKVEAKNLKINDSLQSVYRYKANSKGYLELSNGIESVMESHVAVSSKYGSRPNYPIEHCHHIDGNKQNNVPSNLEIQNSNIHNSEKMFGDKNPMIRFPEKNHFEGLHLNSKDNGNYRHDIKASILKEMYNNGKTLTDISKEVDCSRWCVTSRILGYNHKIVDIRITNKVEDVYNGIVDDTHSYYVMCNDNDAILSANCGEQPLFCGEYNGKQIAESCNLGSLNLLKFVKEDNSGMDYKKLEEAVLVAIDFLDRVIDKNIYPFKFIEDGTKLTRKIGLGVTGFSDYLIQINVPYNSEKAITEAEEIMKFITNKAHLESYDLASEFGKYPLAELTGDKKRNNMCTTIAPTGTIGRLMLGHGYSSGIEPPFAVYMKSNIIETSIDDEIHPLLLKKLEEAYYDTPDIKSNIIERIKQDGSSVQNITKLSDNIKKLFLTADEIPVEQHIKIQAAFQKYTDNAVSKTINIHNKATVSDVSKAFMLAYDSKCKGTTIYRNGSKKVQVLNSIKEEKTTNVELFKDLAPRPAILPALSFVKQTACNTLFINPTYMGIIDKSALEHFIDSHGGCLAMRTGLAMSVSLYQRIIEDINPEYARNALQIVTSHLLKVECPVCKMKIKEERQKIKNGETVEEPVDSISCPNALAQVMDYMLKHRVETYIDGIKFKAELYKTKSYEGIEVVDNKKCPDCGTVLIRQGGCSSFQCPVCMTGGCN